MTWDGITDRRTKDREPAGFKCPECGSQRSRVINKRVNTEGTRMKRRHQCRDCPTRFTSFAEIDPAHTTCSTLSRQHPPHNA